MVRGRTSYAYDPREGGGYRWGAGATDLAPPPHRGEKEAVGCRRCAPPPLEKALSGASEGVEIGSERLGEAW